MAVSPLLVGGFVREAMDCADACIALIGRPTLESWRGNNAAVLEHGRIAYDLAEKLGVRQDRA